MKVGVVTEFRGEYAFLSNFYEADFVWRGHTYPTIEHSFQAAKGLYMKDGVYIEEIDAYMSKVRTAPTPTKAKYYGNSVDLNVKEWDHNKVWLMREMLHAKFSQVPGLAGQLINTGAMMLVEGNDWNDTFWGRCNGKGFNTLGALLMEERGYWLKGDFK